MVLEEDHATKNSLTAHKVGLSNSLKQAKVPFV